mmetsp:Transcript_25085/g.78693  ORF Transcript_25085/g.78693 Transcript_25085/m.78693 type:complete len:249 (+) Transcript_25085:554-1300(+)
MKGAEPAQLVALRASGVRGASADGRVPQPRQHRLAVLLGHGPHARVRVARHEPLHGIPRRADHRHIRRCAHVLAVQAVTRRTLARMEKDVPLEHVTLKIGHVEPAGAQQGRDEFPCRRGRLIELLRERADKVPRILRAPPADRADAHCKLWQRHHLIAPEGEQAHGIRQRRGRGLGRSQHEYLRRVAPGAAREAVSVIAEGAEGRRRHRRWPVPLREPRHRERGQYRRQGQQEEPRPTHLADAPELPR